MTRTRSKLLMIATLILSIAALSACSSGASMPPAGATSAPNDTTTNSQPAVLDSGAPAAATAAVSAPDPCSLITDAEAATLFGGPVKHKAGGSRDASNGSGVVVTENRCEWDLITSDQLGHALWVAVYAGADRAFFNDAIAHDASIPGLGDAANGSSNHVYVISKGTVLQIYGSLPADAGLQQAAAIAIAKF